jgi:hypothetical protein
VCSIEWKVAGVSTAGFSHQAEGSPCQDFHIIRAEGGWLVAAVSDGAGSALRSAEGAKAICEGVVSNTLSHLVQIRLALEVEIETVVRPWIEESIDNVRSTLSILERDLSQFHATLIGVVAGRQGGVFFHIGDGAGCASTLADITSSVISPPENGEYANETYFFTDESWRKHLRLTPFGPEFGVISLMSDGVTPFALAPGGTRLYPPFFEPVSRFLEIHSREEGERALAATLGRDAIRAITGDDKTFVWALRVHENVG